MTVPYGKESAQPGMDEYIRVFEHFLDSELPLFHRTIDGFPYWHFVRFNYHNALLKRLGWIDLSSPRSNVSLTGKIALVAGLLKNGWLHGVHGDRRDAPLLVLSSTNKTTFQGDSRFDPQIDTWQADISAESTVWEPALFWKHLEHPGRSNLYFQDDLRLLALVRANTISSTPELRNEAKVLSEFSTRFGTLIPESETLYLLKSVLGTERACKARIRSALEKKRTRIVAVVNSYDPLHMLVTMVARSMGLYVVELQHGNMGRYHIGYNFRHSDNLPTLPDEILTFGEFWNRTTRIGQNGVNMTITGLPYFEKQLEQVRVTPRRDERTVILFLSQEALGRHLADLAAELASSLDPTQYEVRYKLHPREYGNWKERYSAEFLAAPIKVFDRAGLYELFQESDIHIGVYSTTVMESLAFGKDLILVSSYGVHYYEELLRSGRASLARDAEDLRTIILSRDQGARNWKAEIDYYWAPNAKQNLVSRIEELLEANV